MMRPAEAASNYWNSHWVVEEFVNSKTPEYWQEYFSSIHNSSRLKVLDLGCGGGRNSRMLAERGFDFEACDLHLEMINATKKVLLPFFSVDELENIVIQANMLQLPYSNNTFDYVISNGIYHNTSSVSEFEQAIVETGRILKPFGRLCMNVFTNDYLESNLKKQSSSNLYITPDGLDMILLSKDHIINILKVHGFFPDKSFEIKAYNTMINIGTRSVFRGVFIKNT